MLVFAFFGAVFSSVSWLIYALMFINSKLSDERLMSQDLSTMLMFLAVVFLPILIVWMIFGYVNQFLINRGMNRKQSELLTQLQKNQDYTDLVVRVMLDAEHEIKDGFVLNKFDMFISDMNEALGEIIQRCNIASSAQLEQLWQRVRRGERWTLGKAVLDASKNQGTFNAWVKEKVSRDNVFRGSLLEFCYRYQNLLQLLEKHDRDRIFVRMIESGVFGKVYSIIAPLSEGADNFNISAEMRYSQTNAAIQKTNEYTSALKLATMEEPKAEESIVNVDKNDEFEEELAETKKESFFSRINPFRRKEEPVFDENDEDPFFQALHNSFQGRQDNEDENDFPRFDYSPRMSEPEISLRENIEPKIPASAPSFGHLRSTLDSIKASNYATEENKTREAETELKITQPRNISEFVAKEKIEPSLNADKVVSEQNQDEKDKDENEDLVYPFGGWTDENNYGN
ncbi:MAG: hypothetical protein IJ532_04580 [Alphaproteobacteria bacterium]|nr:hypothetical protein [Alphaproteobacteria bacterium]